MKENILSIFIDESGDFGKLDMKYPYYHVTLVLHEQLNDITDNVNRLESLLSSWGYSNHYIHVGSLIRKEKPYIDELRENRKHIFNALFQFIQHSPIQYIVLSMNKSKCNSKTKVGYTEQLSKLLAKVLRENMAYFMSFSKIILYYDYGQDELVRILTTTFNVAFSNVDIRNVKPTDYRLLQAADFICTVEMTDNKTELTSSEIKFFWSKRSFKKNILKPIRKKLLQKVTYP